MNKKNKQTNTHVLIFAVQKKWNGKEIKQGSVVILIGQRTQKQMSIFAMYMFCFDYTA